MSNSRSVKIGAAAVVLAGLVASIVAATSASGHATDSAAQVREAAASGAATASATPTTGGPLDPSQEATAAPASGTVILSQASASPSPIGTADAATQRFLSSETITGVTRTSAKLTSWADYLSSASTAQIPASLQVAPDRQVWVAAASGTFTPEFGNGQTFSWGAVVYDAATGAALSSAAGPGRWPSWFDALPVPG